MSNKIDCPHCHAGLVIDAIAAVGEDQRFDWIVTPKDGQMMQVEAIGAQLTALENAFRVIAEQDGGKVRSYIEKVAMGEDGSIIFSIAVLDVARLQKTKGNGDADA